MSVKIESQVSLKQRNTFAIECVAEEYCSVDNISDLQEVLSETTPSLILGGGSNLLFRQSTFTGLVLQPELRGISESHQDDCVHVTAMAGENWHEFVMWCVEQNYGGLENLALIPGTVGAAPVQNIGAYGVELSDHVIAVKAIRISDGQERCFKISECEFSYRSSIFKHKEKGKWVITSVTFALTTQNHVLNTSYGAIAEKLASSGNPSPSIHDVAQTVIEIRSSKLPDPAVLPNAGSFFKNPIVTEGRYQELKSEYPDMPAYPQPNQQVKVPAGWLIERSGWKGHRRETCGVHEQHALVLINHNHASGEDMMQLVSDIQESVARHLGINLEPEVNILP